MKERQGSSPITTLSPEQLCLWHDQSFGWDDPDIVQQVDDVDKELGAACSLHWEYLRAAKHPAPHARRPFNLRRVRLRLSALHPALHDLEFWTLDVRSSLLLFLVLLILVSFGAAMFA